MLYHDTPFPHPPAHHTGGTFRLPGLPPDRVMMAAWVMAHALKFCAEPRTFGRFRKQMIEACAGDQMAEVRQWLTTVTPEVLLALAEQMDGVASMEAGRELLRRREGGTA